MWTSPTRPDVGTASGARASNGRLDICLCEVVSLEEERKARGLGESVRKTVAKIQGGGMTALTELTEGLTSYVGLLGIDRNKLKSGASDEEVQIAEAVIAMVAVDDDGGLDKGGGGQQAGVSLFNGFVKSPALGFIVEDGDEG